MTKTLKRTIAGRTFEVDVPALPGDSPGELLVRADDLRRAEVQIAASLAADGPISPESFRYMRAALGIESRTLADLLDVRPETISRWENEKRDLDRAAWFTLGALALDAAGHSVKTMDRLQRLKSKKKPPRKNRLSLHP